MTRETINKSFTLVPFAASNRDNEVIDLERAIAKLTDDVRLITDSVALVTMTDDYDNYLKAVLRGTDSLGRKLPAQPHSIGRALGSKIPDESIDLFTANVSRYTELFNNTLFRNIKGHAERIAKSNGEGYVSAGYRRTVNANKSENVFPKISYSSVDKQVTAIKVAGDAIIWSVKVQGEWVKFYFHFDLKRFGGANKVSLPDVQVADGKLEFRFAAVYDYVSSEISDNYTIGVDVGIAAYVTATVTDSAGKVVETTTLSDRFNRNYNRYRRQQTKFSNLAAKLKNPERRVAQNPLKRARRIAEYTFLREAISRNRRELAILAAQELADLSWKYDNAVVVFEDLTWQRNTMQNGRWNIGELMHWTRHYQHLNGSRVVKTNAAYTSKTCSSCGKRSDKFRGRTFVCESCGVKVDRDVNASINIARRGSKTAMKVAATRLKTISSKKAKNEPTPKKLRRTPKMRETLGYQGQRRAQEVKNHGIALDNTSAVSANATNDVKYATEIRCHDRISGSPMWKTVDYDLPRLL